LACDYCFMHYEMEFYFHWLWAYLFGSFRECLIVIVNISLWI
jgi:hypothetical protein